MKKNRKIFVIIMVGIILLGVIFYPNISKLINLNKNIEYLETRLREVKNENKELKEKTEKISNLDTVEEIARKELGMLKPGEIEYRFVPQPDSVK